MKFIKKKTEDYGINVGDLVDYCGKTCLVTYNEKTFIEGCFGQKQVEFPFELVELNSGNFLIGHTSLKNMNKDSEVTLLAKNKDIELHY